MLGGEGRGGEGRGGGGGRIIRQLATAIAFNPYVHYPFLPLCTAAMLASYTTWSYGLKLLLVNEVYELCTIICFVEKAM